MIKKHLSQLDNGAVPKDEAEALLATLRRIPIPLSLETVEILRHFMRAYFYIFPEDLQRRLKSAIDELLSRHIWGPTLPPIFVMHPILGRFSASVCKSLIDKAQKLFPDLDSPRYAVRQRATDQLRDMLSLSQLWGCGCALLFELKSMADHGTAEQAQRIRSIFEKDPNRGLYNRCLVAAGVGASPGIGGGGGIGGGWCPAPGLVPIAPGKPILKPLPEPPGD